MTTPEIKASAAEMGETLTAYSNCCQGSSLAEALQDSGVHPKVNCKKVIDGTKTELFDHQIKSYIWGTPTTACHHKHTIPIVKHGGGSIMQWGCSLAAGAGSLVKVDGKMNAAKYMNILEDNLIKT